jgi:S1-C subfamily serine protease
MIKGTLVGVLTAVLFASLASAQSMQVETRQEALQSIVQIAPYNWEASQFFGWTGSGTIISADGHLLTNVHVILGADGAPQEVLPILTTDAKAPSESAQLTYLAVLVDSDATLDLALLKIVTDIQGNPLPEDHVFTFAPIGTIERLLLGDSVYVIGFPGVGGNTITLTSGIVSGFLGHDLKGSGNAWVKTDARMAPGNSGGGAFDAAGTLIGIPTRYAGEASGFIQELFRPINYGYAMISQHVPANALQVGARSLQHPARVAPSRTAGATRAIQGMLGMSDSRYFRDRSAHAYSVIVPTAGLVHVALDSVDFDPYLVVLTPSGATLLEVDDSLGAGLNVSESARFGSPGTYTIIVTTALAWESGSYRLSVNTLDREGDIHLEIAGVPGVSTDAHALDYSGRWSGVIIDTAGGRGGVVANLVQTRGAIVEGTWEATFSWGQTSGTMIGLIQSEGLFVELYPGDRTACPFSGLAELAGFTIAGAYTAFDCTLPIAGSISLTRRQ